MCVDVENRLVLMLCLRLNVILVTPVYRFGQLQWHRLQEIPDRVDRTTAVCRQPTEGMQEVRCGVGVKSLVVVDMVATGRGKVREIQGQGKVWNFVLGQGNLRFREKSGKYRNIP